MSGMEREIAQYQTVAKAIVELMHPFVEVVIHDLRSGEIAAIYNPFSGRKVGEPSLIDFEEGVDVYPAYLKPGSKGERIKSTTASIRDEAGRVIALFCLNFDLSFLDRLKLNLDSFLSASDQLPAELFAKDWRERIHQFLHQYGKAQGVRIDALGPGERRELVADLKEAGALEPKRAVEYLAHLLGVSRATLFKDLAAGRAS